MDYLCGAMVIAKRVQSRGNPHDITLPKSWIIRLVQDIDKIAVQDTELGVEYDKYIGDLLEQVYSGVNAGACNSRSESERYSNMLTHQLYYQDTS